MRPPTPSDIESAAVTEEGILLTQSFKPITAYRPPDPGTGTGTHRYGMTICCNFHTAHVHFALVFLLFREPGLQSAIERS